MDHDVANPEALDRVFGALDNPHRRAMVLLLGLQPYAIHRLAQLRELSLPAINKHVTVLEQAGLVTKKKRGRTSYLTLNRGPLRGLQEWVGQFHPYWGSDEATFENYDDYLSSRAPHLDAQPPFHPKEDPQP